MALTYYVQADPNFSQAKLYNVEQDKLPYGWYGVYSVCFHAGYVLLGCLTCVCKYQIHQVFTTFI